MTQKWGLFVFTFFMFHPLGEGFAFYCEPLEKLKNRAENCLENEIVFSDPAVLCLEKYENEVKVAVQNLQERYATNAEGQSDPQAFNKKNHDTTIEEINRLISIGRMAKSEVSLYANNLILPEDWDVSSKMGFTLNEFIDSIPCYAENRDTLVNVQNDFQQMVNDLIATKNKNLQLGAKSAFKKIRTSGLVNDILVAPSNPGSKKGTVDSKIRQGATPRKSEISEQKKGTENLR